MKKAILILSLLLFFVAMAIYSTATVTTQTMMWEIPFNISERTLWLNWTQEEYGWEVPDQICFGLGKTSVCLGGDKANVNMYQKNITNTSYIESDYYCNATGTCKDLSEWGGSGGVAAINGTHIAPEYNCDATGDDCVQTEIETTATDTIVHILMP